MDGLATDAGKYLLTQGVLGVLVVLLIGAVIYLFRQGNTKDEKRIGELNRMIEARETVAKALNANSMALEANNKAMEQRTRAQEEMADELSELRTELLTQSQAGTFNVTRIIEKLDEILKRTDRRSVPREPTE